MLLNKLTEAMGPSGYEDEVRDLIRQEIRSLVEKSLVEKVETDVLGNLICAQNVHGSGPRVMLDAHMDEVGLMVVDIEDNGLLRFRPIGGIDPRVLVAKPVHIGPKRRPGVIGAKPIHLQSPDERRRPIPFEQLYIDIGARDKDDARRVVKPGDVAVFATRYEEIGDNCAKAKSFDDRVGCAVVVEALKRRWRMPVYAAFTVQEEIGLRGAVTAAYRIQPDIAIAVEGTVCYDVAGAPGHGEATRLGAGPALTVQDSRTIADRRFLDFMLGVAEKYDIPVQLRRVKGGSNDFGAIHQTRAGVIGGSISVPVRYIHAPAQVISLVDYQNTIRLLLAVLTEIERGGFPG